jgi:CRISPR-associated protein Csy2
MRYLVFPHVHVQTANICNTNFLIGGPLLTAAYGLGQAVCFKLGGAQVKSLFFIHHDMQPLGEFFYGTFQPQQRRGASFTFERRHDSDYSSKNKHALSLQPTATAHLHVSIVWEVEGLDDASGAAMILDQSSLGGGMVVRHGRAFMCDDLSEAFKKINSGWIVADRRDLLEDGGSDQLSEMIEALGTRKPGNEWLSATCVGYAPVTKFEERGGARDGYEHAFAEPLAGLVQYVSLKKLLAKEAGKPKVNWMPTWAGDHEDVFLLRGECIDSI